jgi:hypothetical protein
VTELGVRVIPKRIPVEHAEYGQVEFVPPDGWYVDEVIPDYVSKVVAFVCRPIPD